MALLLQQQFRLHKPSSSVALSNKTAPFLRAISNLLPNEVPKLASSSLIFFHFSFRIVVCERAL
jgi:hypothetical protein